MYLIPGFEIKGGSEDFGSKFKKWKFVLHWYEGVPSVDVILTFYHKQARDKMVELLKKFNQNLGNLAAAEQQEEFDLQAYQQNSPYV